MPTHQTQEYIRNYIRENVKNGIMNLIIRIVTNVLDWILTVTVGYEVNKITSEEKRDIWLYAEFFGVLTLCVWVWIMKCCCLNKFCINCCIKCATRRRRAEQNIEASGDENETGEKKGMFETVLEKLHMMLNRLAIGAIGFEIRKQISKFKPLTTWDYIEISLIILFCIWILTIKYCCLKCHCLKCCGWCIKGCRFGKRSVARESQNAQKQGNSDEPMKDDEATVKYTACNEANTATIESKCEQQNGISDVRSNVDVSIHQ